MKIVPLFLKTARELGGLGLTEKEIGIYYGSYGAAAFVIGSLLAGYFIAARGLQKHCLSFAAPSTYRLSYIRSSPSPSPPIRFLSVVESFSNILAMVSDLSD